MVLMEGTTASIIAIICFTADVHGNNSQAFFDVEKSADLLRYYANDLGQYIFNCWIGEYCARLLRDFRLHVLDRHVTRTE